MSTETQPDPKERAIEVWSLGSYNEIAADYLPAAARLVEVAAVESGDTVLDVACGSGNVALTAWHAGADVTGVDLVPGMLDLARENAAITGAEDIEWREGEIEQLPFDDDAFDVVLLCFGPEVARDGDAAVRELLRVTKPGGRVAFASWTPAIESIFLAPVKYLPERPKMADFSWGDPERVRERLGDGVRDLEFRSEVLPLYYRSPQHFWQHMVDHAGPFMAMLSQVDEADRGALTSDVIDVLGPLFEGNAIRVEYLITSGTVA